MNRNRTWLVVAGVAAILMVAVPRGAHACGGFFCDRQAANGPIPIAQAAENVLFVMDTDPATGVKRVEAHVQILYTGPAANFSWIVPVTAVPTVDVGWDILFDRIEPPTRPSFQVSYQNEGTCQGQSSGGIGCGSVKESATSGGAGGRGVTPPAVEVISRGSVGPFDYVVVRSEDGATLRTWLETNGYFVSDDAARIVDEYVAGQYSFVAVKLQAGQDTSAIRPIILRVNAPEACLPLKLTAIAATPDLRINVWVLADARAVPINYAEIGINLAKVDWFNAGKNYDQLLKEAANEAQGNAFAVEYAVGGGAGVAWLTAPTAAVRAGLANNPDPPGYVSTLTSLGFPPTGEVLELLKKYIPLPASLASQGVTEASFYTSLYAYWNTNRADFAPFDPAALTADLETNVFGAMDTLRPTFERIPYLTRLATFISPEEMQSDPLFVTNQTLPAVSPLHMAVAHVLCGNEDYNSCNAPIRLQLEDGRNVMFQATAGACGQYDRADLDLMPSSDVGYSRDADSAGQVVVDNRSTIKDALTKHNNVVNAAIDSGCGCSLRGRPRTLAALASVALGLLVLRRRRRRA